MKVSFVFIFMLVMGFSAKAVTIPMVTVGNPGNAPDTRYNSMAVGSVGYVYQIAKFEVTAGQYTEFLNAVAKTSDPNGLYDIFMGRTSNPTLGANVQKSGSAPNYSYSVLADWADRPMNYVTFWDAVRFVNWLHNGQPTGPQGPGTTEDGAYHNVGDQSLFGRNPGAKFVIPTEDEWYKAAYHNKSAGLASSYFDYPSGSNAQPTNTLPDPGNHANYYDAFAGTHGYTIGAPYYRTVVGSFVNTPSPYGTFDQAGNVIEWNETKYSNADRVLRGGAYEYYFTEQQARERAGNQPFTNFNTVGFRVASLIPEPSSLLLAIAAFTTLLTVRRKSVPQDRV